MKTREKTAPAGQGERPQEKQSVHTWLSASSFQDCKERTLCRLSPPVWCLLRGPPANSHITSFPLPLTSGPLENPIRSPPEARPASEYFLSPPPRLPPLSEPTSSGARIITAARGCGLSQITSVSSLQLRSCRSKLTSTLWPTGTTGPGHVLLQPLLHRFSVSTCSAAPASLLVLHWAPGCAYGLPLPGHSSC